VLIVFVQIVLILKDSGRFLRWCSNHMLLRQQRKDIFTKPREKEKGDWPEGRLMAKGFGRPNSVYGILDHKGIARKHGTINLSFQDINSIAFMNQLVKNVQMCILPFNEIEPSLYGSVFL
jgi:hypothetical protein